MQPLEVFVLGPEGTDRTILETTLRRLGHCVAAWDPERDGEHLTVGLSCDVVLVDVRGARHDWRHLVEGLTGDTRPLLMVADQPRRLTTALGGRPAGVMVLTGAESDKGFRVALRLCAALRRRALSKARAESLPLGA